MDADVIAVGKFKKELAPHLDYPEDFYSDTPEGSEIITVLFGCLTSDASKELAGHLGIAPWQFGEHCFDPHKVNLSQLRDWEAEHGQRTGSEVEDFEALRDAGFKFYYRPNG